MTDSQLPSLDLHLVPLLADVQVSDVHIKQDGLIWVRRSGVLECASRRPVSRDDLMRFLDAKAADTGWKADETLRKLEGSGDTDFAVTVGQRRCRANLYWADGKKLALVLRKLHDQAPSLASLGLPMGFHRMLDQSKGLLLVTGATGSGKSTTLASSIEHLNETRSAHIITLEDPIEYLISSRKCLVDQRQVGRDAKTFAAGLRAAMRQDPDILLVGELRDFETVKTALDAANTGHLVLGTLHTHSAQQTVDRLASFFNDDRKAWANAVLSQVLIGVLSQVLVRTADGKGRLLAPELMVATPDVRSNIRDGRIHQIFNAMDTGASRGQVLLNWSLRDLVKARRISKEEALYSTYDPNGLKKELQHV